MSITVDIIIFDSGLYYSYGLVRTKSRYKKNFFSYKIRLGLGLGLGFAFWGFRTENLSSGGLYPG